MNTSTKSRFDSRTPCSDPLVFSLTPAGVPPAAFDYRLGNRSALEWVIDQYRVTDDPRSGVHSDPNRDDDPEAIVRLVGQVVAVSVETMKVVNGLPAEFGG